MQQLQIRIIIDNLGPHVPLLKVGPELPTNQRRIFGRTYHPFTLLTTQTRFQWTTEFFRRNREEYRQDKNGSFVLNGFNWATRFGRGTRSKVFVCQSILPWAHCRSQPGCWWDLKSPTGMLCKIGTWLLDCIVLIILMTRWQSVKKTQTVLFIILDTIGQWLVGRKSVAVCRESLLCNGHFFDLSRLNGPKPRFPRMVKSQRWYIFASTESCRWRMTA